MGKEKRDRYRQWKKMKIRGGGLHMEYDWQRNTAGGGGHKEITPENRVKNSSPVYLKPDVSHFKWHLFLF